ncbi:phosphate regulon sensor histidine kinase PhoR [Aliidiomarina halalkaliphila]|uniref:Phosphate regulon sensor protein PhoR n=1 Tax=Aliidiomarina halalkaliphila TaxID=2593535 RepID=A0A552WZ42_9GAMM|nr:phosphate regulon sensor histidine kinase PhoR [Aliidiomarina halalkaliphila]TRW48092.1 phosphate regulon sensor histidine kinase PhoR [Aliidiomarina halalkaliphila]
MERHYTLNRILKRLLFWVLPFALIGWLSGYFWPSVSLALALALFWNYLFLHRLNMWLWQSRTMLPPRAPGMWSDIYDGIYRTLRRAQTKRRQLAVLLQRFRQAAEAMPDASMVLQRNGNIEWTNKLAQIYFGLRWPADKGIQVTNLIRQPGFKKYFEKGQFDEPFTLNSPQGDERELELRIMTYSEDELLLVARDVTQLRKLERMRKDFVANVSHELKTPLTVMNGYLEMMDSPKTMPPEMLEKAVQDMTLQTQRMQKMVNQLLMLSRMESQMQDTFTKRVDVGTLLRQILNEMRPLFTDKDIYLDAHIDESLSVWGNEEKLHAACSNLLTNAIKYTPQHGQVTVRWHKVGPFAEFSVADTGSGIALEHIPRLTERFYRVDKDRNSATGGTGLGLSIVKHALEHHRSHLQVDSRIGQGSRFWFRISPELLSQPD